ncbi:phospho-N-acetylmuramoyl-pentapeptide-transferase [Candidatus Saccharibacteria bacterium]|nr:phospho-N-acetylmuramoyl-pentapeptide-transferase [Candidatus Saccharibacteria bacterium]MBP5656062.1 phospho-N-acetylmuramoyl-pentapeptide-transferase [Candidatus Saccharibacteria bacterium]
MINDINSRIGYELVVALGAFLLSMFLTPIYTTFAYKHKLWKRQKSVAVTGEQLTVMNKLHKDKIKRHFPTMAGMIMLVTVPVVLITCNGLDRGQTWLPIAAFVGGGLIGFIDDTINLFGKNSAAGLRAPVKFAMITALGAALGWFFAVKLGWTSVMVPYVGPINIGVVGMIVLFAFAVVATGNAVNISDGLDGLAGGLAMLAYGSYGIIALLQEQWFLAAFCFIVLGALLSYIWFNVYPARFMMGDTGSFALGAGLGVVAMMTNSFLLLPIIGALFVVEAGSSLIQICSKKFFRKKVFISAPLHHHLQAKGWEESKVVMRFWVIGGVTAMLGIFLAMGGGIIK